MNDAKLRVLRLLEARKISSEEAVALLEALGRPAAGAPGSGGRTLRIRIYENGSASPMVNVSLPLAWAKFMAPFIESKIKTKLADKGYDLDLGKMQEAIEAQKPMKIVDVQDGGDKVEIFIE